MSEIIRTQQSYYSKEIMNNFGPEYVTKINTLGEEIVHILKHFNIKNLYGVGGDFVAPLIHVLDSHFNLIASSNETHAGFSACAEAELSGLSVCFVTYTVGSLPCVTAAALAKTENLPVIFLSGAPSPNEVNITGLHHMIHSSQDWSLDDKHALKIFSDIGIRAERLIWPSNGDQPSIANEQFYDLILHAIKKRQPVFIEIPRGILSYPAQPFKYEGSIEDYIQSNQNLSNPQLIAQNIFNKLSEAKKPVFLIGEKVKSNPQLIKQLEFFLKKTAIPYATNLFAKGIFDESCPEALGVYNGLLGSEYAYQYIQNECDYLIEICTSILPQDTSTGIGTGTFNVDHKNNVTRLRGTHFCCQDIFDIFLELNKLPVKKYSSQLKDKNTTVVPNSTITFANLAHTLNSIQAQQKDSFVYLPEVGNSYFSSFSLITRKSDLSRSWISNPYYAAMGTCLPYAKAVCIKLKEMNSHNIPIVITGDGGFHFQSNELSTLQRDNCFVIILLLRNDIYHLGKINNSPSYNCNSKNMDYQKLIEAYSGKCYHVKTASELSTAIEQASVERVGIHLIEIFVSTDEKDQSREVRIINLYIKAKAGDKDAIKDWNNLK